MSVRANDRGQHELEVINYSRQLTQYTYERVRGGVFPKADRWIMAKHIWDEIANAHAKIIRANAIRVETAEDAARRLLMESLRRGQRITVLRHGERTQREGTSGGGR